MDHQRQVEELKGEKFNVFSILKMSAKEDKLHSRFIRELLDPQGSHLKGRLFLNHFLQLLNKGHGEEGQHEADAYDVVLREFHIGPVNLQTKTGGRIDIFLRDTRSGRTICIENKIYAGDQQAQVERYCNYNCTEGANRVYYLTLDGREPEEKSCGELRSGEDFYLLSYEKDIIKWLELCLREVYDEPILRESLKQYLILVRKLTHTVSDQFKEEVSNLIIHNLEEVKFLRDQYEHSLQRIRSTFKADFVRLLKQALEEEERCGQLIAGAAFTLYNEEDVKGRWASLWVIADGDPPLKFGLESFSGDPTSHFGGNMFIGVIPRPKRKSELFARYQQEDCPRGWLKFEKMEYDERPVNLGDPHFLKLIHHSQDEKYRHFLAYLVTQSLGYMQKVLEEMKEHRFLLIPDKSKEQI
ncbi:MAG TPA: hypothetical protein DCG19_05950 [Cryomorphaceae bacterium]|nr:hypothetical protein [Owenweeksia sp.]MBF98178.1 hypothetical protein [Owenweeksia sp.]HAD96929.1 hypothetical protein [Cryomorphaceae bacterium]HBF22075.1 hypothetical protein [Cryomorphaceae bacterium]|tara:strand:- start:1780 stop:3018 length:1239 start_codon:yes stop_codon:yes gene_type:complete